MHKIIIATFIIILNAQFPALNIFNTLMTENKLAESRNIHTCF